MSILAEKKSAKSTQKKYPNAKFNNKAIEKSEKNAVNVNVALDRKPTTNATEDYLTEVRKQKELIDDIIIICTILVAGLLYLSLFDFCGLIGTWIKALMMGLMGPAVSYMFPVAMIFFVIFTRSNKGNPVATRKTIYFWTATAFLCALIHLCMHLADKFGFKASFKAKEGGGLIGELLSCPAYALFGNIASILIFVTLILICIMLISGKAVIHAIKKKRAEQKALMKEIREEEREEEERRRAMEERRVAPANTSYNDYKQMSLDDIQEENRRKKLVMVDVEAPAAPEGIGYEYPKAKKRPGIIERLKGYGKKEPKPQPAAPDISTYQPIINATAANPAPAYQAEMERKFKNTINAGVSGVLPDNHTYDEDRAGIPEITNTYPVTPFEKEEEHKPFIPPEEDDTLPPPYNPPKTEDEPFVKPEPPVNATPSDDGKVVSFPGTQKKEKAAISENDPETDIGPVDEITEKPYVFPRIDLLRRPDHNQASMTPQELRATAAKLENTLHSFGVNVTVTNFTSGPNVTRYELQPEVGTKVSRITALADDIKLNLAAEDIRIEAPIPGKSAVGIEVPNTKGSTVYIRTLLESAQFTESKGKIAFAVGKDIAGDAVVTDIAKMPHVLIAGATGSGKSVCINTIIMSILYKYEPKDVRLIMIDPKVVELSVYNGIPHLLIPVVTDPKKAYGALNWAVMEMMDRYKRFAELEVRDVEGYNEKIRNSSKPLLDNEGNVRAELPQILIIVDEMADLMMVSPGEVEEAICRLAQLARAAGIHLVLATQRPTVNVITGLIKANVPSRIAFSVASATDSRTILDQVGAEKLLGKGDMLFFPSGIPKPIRVQGAFVSDGEVKAVVDEIKKRNCDGHTYSEKIASAIDKAADAGKKSSGNASGSAAKEESDTDKLFAEAGRYIIDKEKATIGHLQRVFGIGFNRAARIMDQLAEAGIVGPEQGTKAREILMSKDEFEQYLSEHGE